MRWAWQPDRIAQVIGDTDWTEDAGKTSASRQTFVSGKAAELAGAALRAAILREANAADDATIELAGARVVVRDGDRRVELDLARLKADAAGVVLEGVGRFDPPTTTLDAKGQGAPYATYAFGAQVAMVDVDTELGTVTPVRIHAAHDVGRAINPTQVEGQIEGGIAQGIGLALMEEYLPGKTENLHDYLIPTIGDVPEIEVIIVEDPEPLGPFGAKGVGEPGLVPTAPAILGAIRHATGVRVTRIPALPHRLRRALREQGGAPVSEPKAEGRARDEGSIIRCDACPVLCRIREGKVGACDRYANVGGTLTRVDPLLVTERAETLVPFLDGAEDWDGGVVAQPERFVTGIGSGTTYPDYKPAPFIIASEAAGVDMVTVVSEGIFSYCGVKVKIDTTATWAPSRPRCGPTASPSATSPPPNTAPRCSPSAACGTSPAAPSARAR